jgi:hypothetical protein
MQIDIDFDVYKALTMLRATETTTYNDVLRSLLGLEPQSPSMPTSLQSASGTGWVSKGVHFPDGTDFRATYAGQTHYGKVEAGALVVNGTPTTSASYAARLITGNNVNGWGFWECRLPGHEEWRPISSLRPRK